MKKGYRLLGHVYSALSLASLSLVSVANAQEDPLQQANKELRRATKNVVFFTFEERTR